MSQTNKEQGMHVAWNEKPGGLEVFSSSCQ
jgi:hypothetical protein